MASTSAPNPIKISHPVATSAANPAHTNNAQRLDRDPATTTAAPSRNAHPTSTIR